ncbi:NUDIX hydrolase [Actinomadura vinacea]|uniref:NUDIX hydrolase n=1 Tax=Actinomadura vinacea TaxID=115336 RepID=A0ABN3ID52_9ACTN
MNEALAIDEAGNELLGFLPFTAEGSHVLDPPQPLPLALAAVWDGPRLLLVFNRFRRCWELPGGLIDPGETPYQAAVRELSEETGLDLPALALVGYARFQLVAQQRPEYGAVYLGEARPHDGFVPNDEISAICWWHPASPPPGDAQSLDLTLARLIDVAR